jgi:hypothetical protein
MENISTIKRKIREDREDVVFFVKLAEEFLVPLKSITREEAVKECKGYHLPVDLIIEN